MSDITISVIQPPSTTINVGVDETLIIGAGISFPTHSVTHISGGSDEINHNLLGSLQGGSGNQYYHLNSGQYFNLTTGDVVRPSQTGQFYSSNNPSGYTPTGYVTGVSGNLQTQITNLNNATGSYVLTSQTGSFYPNSNPSGFITGVNLSNYSTVDYTTGISGGLQTQITTLNNQTGSFYPNSNPSAYITGISNLVFTTGNQTISGAKTFANNLTVNGNDLFVDTSNNRVGIGTATPIATLDVNGSVLFRSGLNISGVRPTVNSTGILLSGEATTQTYVTGISGSLQAQITTLNNATGSYVLNTQTGNFITTSQTGAFYPTTNPSGFITGVNLSFSGNYYTKTESESRYVNTTGTETILGDKTFHDKVYINNLYVTGLETIINTTNTNVASNYLLLNLTGGVVDGGIFFITGSGLTGINDSGAIIGFDHSDKFKFGIATRASDLSTLDTIASYEEVTGISGGLQTQISTLNNATGNYALKIETGNFITNSQTGQFYANSNPSGFITGIDLSSYATQVYVTGISGDLQGQITDLNNATGDYILNSQTGQFYANSNPSGFITGVDLSSYATQTYVTGISGELQTQITNLNNATGSYVLNSQTGDFYANSNPSGFITGIENIVFTTGDQTISGIKTFSTGVNVTGDVNINGNLTISGLYNVYQQIENAKILAIAYAIAL